MLGKLLSLLLHAKSGAISGLFLLGASGALVSVSTQNGVTTITITEASPSPSASASPSASPSAHASPSASASPSSSPSSSSCADQAKALAFQVQRVDTAFKGFHTDLMKLRGTRSVADIEKADVMLKVIRQTAVKAIHKTFAQSCKKDDDEDGSAETELDAHDAAPATTLSLVGDRKHDDDHDNDSDHHKTKPAPLTFTGDATSIADQAIAAMQVAFDAAKNAPASTPRPSRSPEQSRSPRPSHSPSSSGPSGSPKHGDHD